MPRIWAFFAENSSSVRMPWLWSCASWVSSAVVSSAAGGGGAGAYCGCGRVLRLGRGCSLSVLGGVLLLLVVGDAAADHAGGADDRCGAHDGSSSSKHWTSSRFSGFSMDSGGAAAQLAASTSSMASLGMRIEAISSPPESDDGVAEPRGPHVLEQQDRGRRVRREVGAEVLDVFLGEHPAGLLDVRAERGARGLVELGELEATTSPAASLATNTRSITRISPVCTSSARAGATSPLNLFPGKLMTKISTGPMLIAVLLC